MSFGIQGTSDPTSLLLQQQQQSGSGMRQFANLNLSEQQRTQIRSIFQNAKAQGLTRSQVQDQIKAILTPAQQATMPAGSQSASDPFANLNLSAQQQTQVTQILQSAKSSGQSWSQTQSQINAVLTPAQQQTFASDVQTAQSAHSGHHHHHHDGDGAGSSSSGQTATAAAPSSSATSLSNGLTEADVQNQVLAAGAINQQQLQNDVLSL